MLHLYSRRKWGRVILIKKKILDSLIKKAHGVTGVDDINIKASYNYLNFVDNPNKMQ